MANPFTTTTATTSGWQTVLTIMVRALINDTGASPTFTNARIEEAVVIAGIIVGQEYSYDNDYVFDVEAPDITPDPVDENDYTAMALITLKTACIFDTNRYQAGVSTGIRIRDGDSEIDLTSGLGAHRGILELGPCASYDKLLEEITLTGPNAAGRYGKAVVGPFTHTDLAGTDVRNFFSVFGLARR